MGHVRLCVAVGDGRVSAQLKELVCDSGVGLNKKSDRGKVRRTPLAA